MVMVAPSGLTQVPWVSGAVPELGVLVGEGVGLGVAVGVGEGLGLGLGVAVGAGDGDAVETVNVVLAVRELPAASVARAVTVWLPSARPDSGTLQLAVPDAGCQPPPSTESETALTPTLSEALPRTVRVELVVLPLVGDEIVTEGAVVSVVLWLRGFGAARVGAVAARASGTATEATRRARAGVRTGVAPRGSGTRLTGAVAAGGDTLCIGRTAYRLDRRAAHYVRQESRNRT
jgi:hypothetical protein